MPAKSRMCPARASRCGHPALTAASRAWSPSSRMPGRDSSQRVISRSAPYRQTRGHGRRSPGERGAPGTRGLTTRSVPARRLRVLSYRVILDVPFQLAAFVSGLLAEHRRELGTRPRTRALTCWKQAVFALAWFRDRPDIRRLGAGFGISQATAYPYKDEAVEVLAAKAPSLREALGRAAGQGLPYLILDARSSPPTGAWARRPAGKAGKSTPGTPARRMSPPGTCRRWPPRAASRCGSATCCRAAPTTLFPGAGPLPAPMGTSNNQDQLKPGRLLPHRTDVRCIPASALAAPR